MNTTQAAACWDTMFEALVRFKAAQGHCIVPTNSAVHACLGRWVAAQRYKRRNGRLDAERIARLDAIGFVWSPAGRRWDRMFGQLEAFRRQHGHCNVPEKWPSNQPLATWVQRQRHLKRKGTLPSERVRRLDVLGFRWAVYKTTSVHESDAAFAGRRPSRRLMEWNEERLYVVRYDCFVQHRDGDPPPQPLEHYIRRHGGELPPFIPLPPVPTRFFLGPRHVRQRPVTWDGRGALPEPVLEYVRLNGALPRHEC